MREETNPAIKYAKQLDKDWAVNDDKKCCWNEVPNGIYETECGEIFRPLSCDQVGIFTFCPFCGNEIS